MIIKNNYNDKSVDPLSNYESIRDKCDDNVNKENRKHARRFEKKILKDLVKDEEISEEENGDEIEDNKWYF